MAKGLIWNRDVMYSTHPPFPHNMLIELTNSCNHKCVFCQYDSMRRKKSLCDKDFMFDIMRQAYAGGTREIGFYMIGEPLLKVDLEDYVEYAHDLGFEYIYLTTNGALATVEKMRGLIEKGLNSIKFSVNAATRENYKIIHGRDDYESVKKNIYDLRDFLDKSSYSCKVVVACVKTTLTENEIDKLYDDYEAKVDDIFISSVGCQGTPKLDLIKKGFTDSIRPGKNPCDIVFNRLNITCEGYLDACCSDVDGLLAAVDLHDMSLEDAWYSDVMVELRRDFINNKLKKIMCYNCTHLTDFEVVPLNPQLYDKIQSE